LASNPPIRGKMGKILLFSLDTRKNFKMERKDEKSNQYTVEKIKVDGCFIAS
jgi:hypothetical protein